MSKAHRLITSKPVKKDLVFNSKRRLGGLPVNPGGQWDPFLPIGDPVQNLSFSDPECCASAGTLHSVSILLKQELKRLELYSYRFLAKSSGTTTSGNDPHVVAETLRKTGCMLFSDYPYTSDIDTWEKFYSTLTPNMIAMARAFPATYQFGHEFVPGDANSMKAALNFSPLCAAVWAWGQPNQEGVYSRPSPYDDHWVVIYGYEEGKFWKCFDSYNTVTKKLAWDFGFTVVKRYTINLNIIDETWQGWFIGYWRNFRSLLGFPAL